MNDKKQSKPERSIRFQLVMAVNCVLLIFAIAFLFYDYRRELNGRIEEKKTALQEEAKTLLPSILHLKSHGRDLIQTYVNDVCGRMEDSDSPSHHIAVEYNGELIQAHAHHRASSDLVSAMKIAANTNDQHVRTEEIDLVVGTLSEGDTSVFVSEDISQIRVQVFGEVIRRMWGLVLMGLLGVAVVNLVLVRIVSRPLQVLVDKVREVGQGSFDTQLTSFGSSELNFLSTEINAMSDALATSQRDREFRLDKARKIQENLLPVDIEIPGVGVGMIYSPAEEVGGDYFDILPHGENAWLVCVADATDHGVPAAMTAAMLKTLLLQGKEHVTSPAEILRKMNRIFMEVNLYGDFASIILLRLDFETKQLIYANAGHDPAWLIGSEGQSLELQATGTLLGIDEDEVWEEQTLALREFSRLAISTDGITETFNSAEKQFGKQRLLDELLKHAEFPAAQTAADVHRAVQQFRGAQTQSDDITLLLVDLQLTQAANDRRPNAPAIVAADGKSDSVN